MAVNDHNKIDALIRITEALQPSEICVAIDRFEEKSHEFQKWIQEIPRHHILVMEECTIVHFTTKHEGGRSLLVVFDATLPKDICNDFVDSFIVVLVAPRERALLDKGIKELNALTYVYFHGVREVKIDQNKKGEGNISTENKQLKWKEWKKHVSKGQ
ncbi:uncharacterized protein LOC133902106 [Phragmites australis]|uniref:uncharacterized protein LOC133902106 n=1 Tax=Phragmites australis TaxID=29695 RepID=UPI002D765A52|nr:uncharacterized protein LOC133902106 [Phragmites australis]